MKFISTVGIIDGVQTRKDKSWKITIVTPELPPDQGSILMSMANLEGVIYFSPHALTEQELIVPEVQPDFKGEKSPSQQLRGILYRIWEQTTDKSKPFPDFYKNYMFRLCEQLKEKLS